MGKDRFRLSFFEPYIDGRFVVLEARAIAGGIPVSSRYQLPKAEIKESPGFGKYIHIGEGQIDTISRMKRGGIANRMMDNLEPVFRQIAARSGVPLVHEPRAYSSTTQGLFEKRGYEKVDHQKRRKVFQPNGGGRLLPMKKELAIKHLMGEELYHKTRPRK